MGQIPRSKECISSFLYNAFTTYCRGAAYSRVFARDFRSYQRWLQPASEASIKLASDGRYIDLCNISRRRRNIDVVSSVSISIISIFSVHLNDVFILKSGGAINGNYGTKTEYAKYGIPVFVVSKRSFQNWFGSVYGTNFKRNLFLKSGSTVLCHRRSNL